MDPLSVIGSVAGIIQLSQAVSSGLANYIMTAKDATGEVQELLSELKALQPVLQQLQSEVVVSLPPPADATTDNKKNGADKGKREEINVTVQSGAPAALSDSVLHTLEETRLVLEELFLKIRQTGLDDSTSPSEPDQGGKPRPSSRIGNLRQRASRAYKRLKYPWKKGDLEKLRQRLRDCKSSLSLALAVDHRKLVAENTEKTRVQIQTTSLQTENLLKTIVEGLGILAMPPEYTPSDTNRNYFEVPYLPVNFFTGRKAIIDKISSHFSESPNQQTILSVYGLGGTGKTQLALTYASKSRQKYPTVFFFNASSNNSLSLDFARYHALLGLPSGSDDKTGDVKRWLARAGNEDWLLIFDNADDLDEVKVKDYFPQTPNWGHILITSRDHQASDPNLATFSIELNEMEPDEAKTLLLSRSQIPPASVTEAQAEQIDEIVKKLGYLPLAIDQAGAFIHTRKKSFKDYLTTFDRQRDKLLAFQSKMSSYDQTVITTWEISFQRLEQDSPEAAQLLLLLCHLDSFDVADEFLRRGCTPQKRWGEDGEIYVAEPSSSGVPDSLVKVCCDEWGLDELTGKLLSYSLVQRKRNEGFGLHPLVKFCGKRRMSEEDNRRSVEEAICLTTHAYPRGTLEAWEDDFCKRFLPQVNNCCELLEETGASKLSHVTEETAMLLLGAYHFCSPTWGERYVVQAEALLDHLNSSNETLRAFTAERKGKTAGYGKGDKDKAIEVLYEFYNAHCKESVRKDNLTASGNAMHGTLIVLLATFLSDEDRVDEAIGVITSWQVGSNPSTSERGTLRYQQRVLAGLYIRNGDVEKAEAILSSMVKSNTDGFQHSMGHGWATAQLGTLYIGTSQLTAAKELLLPALVVRKEAGQESREDTICILFAYISALLAESHHEEALPHLLRLRQLLEPIVKVSMRNMQDLITTWCFLARVSFGTMNWEQSSICWSSALDLLAKVTSLSKSEKEEMGRIIRASWAIALKRAGKLRDYPDLEADLQKWKSTGERPLAKVMAGDVSLGKAWDETIARELELEESELGEGGR